MKLSDSPAVEGKSIGGPVPLRARLKAAARSAAIRSSTFLSNLTAIGLLAVTLSAAFLPQRWTGTVQELGHRPTANPPLAQRELPLDISPKRVVTERIVVRPPANVATPPAAQILPQSAEETGGRRPAGASPTSAAADPGNQPAQAPKADPAPTSAQQPAAQQSPETSWPAEAIAAALDRCKSLLATGNVSYEPQQPVRSGTCGAPAPIKVNALGQTAVALAPSIVANCPLAAMLDTWVDKILQPAAQAILGSAVTRLVGTSSYVCRNRNGAAQGPISEHAFANAFDIASFALADGRVIDVRAWTPRSEAFGAATVSDAGKLKAKDLSRTDPKVNLGGASLEGAVPASDRSAPGPEVIFLKRIHKGACALFGTVLGPEANAAHREHLHFDLKTRRGNAYCQ